MKSDEAREASGSNSGLKQRVIKAALLSYCSNMRDAQVAETMGIGISTLAEWKQRAEWQATIKTIASDMWNGAVDQLMAATRKATETLVQLLDSDNEGVRLRAATSLIDRGLKPLT